MGRAVAKILIEKCMRIKTDFALELNKKKEATVTASPSAPAAHNTAATRGSCQAHRSLGGN